MVVSLRHRFYLRTFVETGTAWGDTALAAFNLGMFERVITIEASRSAFDAAKPEFKASKVERVYGKTEEELARIVPTLTTPTLFYLDAHWCGGPKLGPECPLLAELAVLRPRQEADAGDVIMIDNAGMFRHPPHPPHDPAQWPTLDQVIRAIHTGTPQAISMFLDVLIVATEPIWETF
jgi:hypothetical protein